MRIALAGILCTAAACGDNDMGFVPCQGADGRPCIEIRPGPTAQEDALTALIMAETGDVIHFGAGTYQMTGELSLTVDGVTIRGDGMDNTILSFSGQTSGAQSLTVSADDFTLENIALEDGPGDLVKVEGATGVTVRHVRTEWTNGPDSANGGYGVYPVQCSNVLVEDSVAIGASDTGVYIGQSRNVIIRRNHVEENVIGIEIENSVGVDVYENDSSGNTGGIMVISLPGLQEPESRNVRVFDNHIHENNVPNFAPEGNIVGVIPQGTGLIIITAHDVEAFDNQIENNQTVNLAIGSYLLGGPEYDDPDYYVYPDAVYAHDNTFVGGGDMPSEGLGFLLLQAMTTIGATAIPDMVWDGYADPEKLVEGQLPDDLRICLQRNGDADFAMLDAPNEFANVTTDLAPYDCAHDPIPPVTIPGVN